MLKLLAQWNVAIEILKDLATEKCTTWQNLSTETEGNDGAKGDGSCCDLGTQWAL